MAEIYSLEMRYPEFRRNLGKAGLTVKEFAELVSLRANSVSNYAVVGQVPTHLAAIAALMGEMAEHQLDFRQVLQRIDLQRKRVRGGAKAGRFGGSKQRDLFTE